MIQRVNKNSDLVIQLDVDLTEVRDFHVEYYTDGEFIKTVYPTGIDGLVYVTLSSEDLNKMNDGVLKCTIRYYFLNDDFPDKKQNIIEKQTLGMWIYSGKV